MSQINLRTIPNNLPSLCIPRVFPNIDEKRIRRIFNDLGLGEIHRIDIVNKTTDKGEKFNRIFVHFQRWFSNSNADTARERLMNGKEIKIIYDDPWFWKVSAYRPPASSSHHKASSAPAAAPPPPPRIMFDDELDKEEKQPPKQKLPLPRQMMKPSTSSTNTNTNTSLHLALPNKRQIVYKKQQKTTPAKKTSLELEDGEILES
jgi:hypothetical protein